MSAGREKLLHGLEAWAQWLFVMTLAIAVPSIGSENGATYEAISIVFAFPFALAVQAAHSYGEAQYVEECRGYDRRIAAMLKHLERRDAALAEVDAAVRRGDLLPGAANDIRHALTGKQP